MDTGCMVVVGVWDWDRSREEMGRGVVVRVLLGLVQVKQFTFPVPCQFCLYICKPNRIKYSVAASSQLSINCQLMVDELSDTCQMHVSHMSTESRLIIYAESVATIINTHRHSVDDIPLIGQMLTDCVSTVLTDDRLAVTQTLAICQFISM